MRVLQIVEKLDKSIPVEITDGTLRTIYKGEIRSIPLPVLCREVTEVRDAYFENIRKYGFVIETEAKG